MIFNFIKGLALKHIFKVVSMVILGVGVLAALWYYNWSQKEMATLRENNAALNVVVKEQDKTIEQLKHDFSVATALLKIITLNNSAYAQNLLDLTKKFTKNGRDLNNLAVNRPAMIERIVNDATEQAIVCNEKLTEGKRCE